MIYLATSYSGLISLVEIQDKFNSERFCNLVENKVLSLILLYFPIPISLANKTTVPFINLRIVDSYKRKNIESLN